jgi:hypothetical protein
VLAAEYQEQTWMLCDLSWSSRHGCYVIFHVKPLDLAAEYQEQTWIIIVYFDDLVSSALSEII